MRISHTLVMLSIAAVGVCPVFNNAAAQYLQRSDTITLGAGNAKDVNAATHVIDPWPRYVGDRRIPADAERMSTAISRYRRPSTRPQGAGAAGPGGGTGGDGLGGPGAPPGGGGAAASASANANQ
jgi:hypothetical protein